ncbi:MAG TPA: tetratricopeptide repeat protein [Patescibacteria group bacterium]
MDPELAQRAITAALNGDWHQAVKVNTQILQIEPDNIDALNRIARAYCEIGNVEKAKRTSKKVLKIDPFNGIACKCLKKWERVNVTNGSSSKTGPLAFLEEPGKTKIVKLINLGDSKIIANLDCGDEVRLIPHSHSVSVTTMEGKHVGKIPDDLAMRLINLMRNGGTYQTLIKVAEPEGVKIFIRGIFL